MRLRQFADVAAERAGLLESVAQSEKMAAIGRLAAGVAHEINNPLAIIQAQVGVLLERLGDVPGHPLSDEIRDRLRKVGAQVERGRKVTHRLLGFSRRVGPDVEPVDLAAALDETLGFVEKEAENLRIRIGREYDPEAPIVRSSLSQIQQVYLNLLNNAMDAVGHDGEIRLAVARVPGGVEVRIADNGPGIDEEGLTRLFEPFSTTKGAGTRHIGLGLSICREIMHNLGGRIGVESEVRKGTTFTLWFPHAPEGTDAAPGAVPPDPA
jgi:two-component system NtrC family sensor kinase